MKLLPARTFLAVLFAGLFASAAFAEDPKAALLAAEKAQLEAPACRMKATMTDSGAKSVTAMTLEMVSPDQLHLKMEEDGKLKMEMVSDGKKVFVRQGEGKFQEAPPAAAAMITNLRKNITLEAMVQMAKDVKAAGHEDVGGTPATIYTFTTDVPGTHSTNKLWVSDKDQRPLKGEGEVHNDGSAGGRKRDLQVAYTCDYDSSIKITLPAG